MTAALMAAADAGPKQYAPLGGRTVLAHAVKPFLDHPLIDHVLAVIHPGDRPAYEAAMAVLGQPAKLLPPVIGGATRQHSVRAIR